MTAANSSSISDGAAALVDDARIDGEAAGRDADRADRRTQHVRAGAFVVHDGARRRDSQAVRENGWRAQDVDLYEINEAFAVVTMAAMREHDLPHDKVNVNGGACALGHPIGASGARILVTLIGALKARGLKRGVASLCIGGGEATAMGVEVV